MARLIFSASEAGTLRFTFQIGQAEFMNFMLAEGDDAKKLVVLSIFNETIKDDQLWRFMAPLADFLDVGLTSEHNWEQHMGTTGHFNHVANMEVQTAWHPIPRSAA